MMVSDILSYCFSISGPTRRGRARKAIGSRKSEGGKRIGGAGVADKVHGIEQFAGEACRIAGLFFMPGQMAEFGPGVQLLNVFSGRMPARGSAGL
jgi:hypothetical protein